MQWWNSIWNWAKLRLAKIFQLLVAISLTSFILVAQQSCTPVVSQNHTPGTIVVCSLFTGVLFSKAITENLVTRLTLFSPVLLILGLIPWFLLTPYEASPKQCHTAAFIASLKSEAIECGLYLPNSDNIQDYQKIRDKAITDPKAAIRACESLLVESIDSFASNSGVGGSKLTTQDNLALLWKSNKLTIPQYFYIRQLLWSCEQFGDEESTKATVAIDFVQNVQLPVVAQLRKLASEKL